MAEASISVDLDQFSCSVCLDLLKDPVTIPCGHSYCMSCISGCWDQEDQKGIYSCPQCRQTFTPIPVLNKNVVFAEMVEKLKKTSLQAAAPSVHHTGSGDVQCDSCTGIKQKAVKSCLECRSSYCQNHLEQHENLFRGNKHNLVDITGHLQEMICPQHDKLLEMYCRTDQQCICMLCLVDEHKNHDTVSTAAERKEKQRHSEEMQRKFLKLNQQRENDVQQLREAVESHKRSAQTAVEDSEWIFTELIHSIEKRRSEVKQLIRDQERAAVSRAEEQLERLKKEIDDHRRKVAELKQLSETQDHVHFFQSLSSVSLSGSTDGFTVSSHLYFDDVVKSVSQLRDKLQQFCTNDIQKISKRVKTVQVMLTPEYETREEFLHYSHPVVLTAEEPSFTPDLQPLPVSLFKPRGRKLPAPTSTPKIPAPVSIFQVQGTKPLVKPRPPTSIFKVEGAKPPVKPRPPTSIFKVGVPKPMAPVSIFEMPKPAPTPTHASIFGVGGAKPLAPVPAPVSIFQPPKPLAPALVSIFEIPKPLAPTPVGIFGVRGAKPPAPAPVSIFQPPKPPTPAPVSIFQPPKPLAPALVSIFEIPKPSAPTPVGIFGVRGAQTPRPRKHF